MDHEEIWNIELKGFCTNQDLPLFCDLMVKFASKFSGIGLNLLPADVKTIEAAAHLEIDEYEYKK